MSKQRMNTPVADFARRYAETAATRFHMPGHKGTGPLGIEKYDLTEIEGADELYKAEGIIKESENNASRLFGSAATIYSTEGSTQCIKAMLYLAVREDLRRHPDGEKPWVLAARNAHKAFVYAAAMLDFEVEWIWPDDADEPLVSCTVSPEKLEAYLSDGIARHGGRRPAAVYVTSPDYLGKTQDIAGISECCHRHGTLLITDNAHGAYLRFLKPSRHPLDLGADLCCDSAHKTLPVITGGAYLHISENAPQSFVRDAEKAMSLFCSTSPSYLIMESLDLANAYIADGYPEKLENYIEKINELKTCLRNAGYTVMQSDPLRITVNSAAASALHGYLRREKAECEFADETHLVFMLTPENGDGAPELIRNVLLRGDVIAECAPAPGRQLSGTAAIRPERKLSIREAMLMPSESTDIEKAVGRISAAPTVSCPPAVPIAVSGEVITADMLPLFRSFGIRKAEIVSHSYDAVVFDMDGVIFDSERGVLRCWTELGEKYGMTDVENIFHRCIGITAVKTGEILAEAYGKDFPYPEFRAEASQLFHSRYDGGKLPVKPGTFELLEYLKGSGIRTALATSTKRETVIKELTETGLIGYFDEIVCGDMVARSKPAPDIYLKACEMLGVSPDRAYAIEDSYNGIRSASAGGLLPLMVPDLLPATEEMQTLAVRAFSDLGEVLEFLK